MLKAGALYFAIVIAFFIAIISASLIMLAAHYRSAYLKELRMDRLLNNLNSGIDYVMNNVGANYGKQTIDLYKAQTDSLIIERKQWGIYDLAIIKAFIVQDTLQKAMLIGTGTDSTAIYLSDEDRPLAISGNTKIIGNVTLPKSGIRQAYAEGKPYTGKQLVYDGIITSSDRSLKPLDQQLLKAIKKCFKANAQLPILQGRLWNGSFIDSAQRFRLPQKAVLERVNLNGNIMLFADSAITIKSTAILNNVQIYAPYIRVESGFVGNCQLFATDSVVVGNGAVFNYPSVIGLFKDEKNTYQPKISLGENVRFNGILFTSEEKLSVLQTKISLGKKSIVNGEVYCAGFFQMEKSSSIKGKVSCHRFLMQTITTRYENFLIDVELNRKARSKYYLGSKFFNSEKQTKVLKWLD